MAKREPPVELFYDPAGLDPDAPRLHVRKNGSGWELRNDRGALLGTHHTREDAIDAALDLSKRRFSEILVRGSTGQTEWVVNQDPRWLKLTQAVDRDLKRRREAAVARPRVAVGAFPGHHVFLPARRRCKEGCEGQGAASPAPVELYYDPAELDPDAPRLHIRKDNGVWVVRDADGSPLSSHAKLPEAINAAEERSRVRFSEILVRGAVNSIEWSVSRNPEMVELAQVLNAPPSLERKATAARRRVDVGAFWGHHVLLPVRRRRKEAGDGGAAAAPRTVERVYDPSDLDPGAPRLHISKDGGMWELRDDDGQMISCHGRLPEAMDAALALSDACFSEILVRTAGGDLEWSLRHNSDWTELARVLNRPNGAEREAAD